MFWQNVLLFSFKHQWKILFLLYWLKISHRKMHWYCHNKVFFFTVKHFKIRRHISFCRRKNFFSVFNRVPSDKLNVFFFAKLFIIIFQRPWKACFISIQDFYFKTTRVLSIFYFFFFSVKNFKICISKIFMRPRFFTTLDSIRAVPEFMWE